MSEKFVKVFDYNSVVHSNEMECRKSGHLGLDIVQYKPVCSRNSTRLLKFHFNKKNSIVNQINSKEQFCYGKFVAYLVHPYIYCILCSVVAFHIMVVQ